MGSKKIVLQFTKPLQCLFYDILRPREVSFTLCGKFLGRCSFLFLKPQKDLDAHNAPESRGLLELPHFLLSIT
jgi:hypothetical protein